MRANFIPVTCPKCGTQSNAMIVREIADHGTKLRQIVFDSCHACGTKLTEYKEWIRKITPEEKVKYGPVIPIKAKS